MFSLWKDYNFKFPPRIAAENEIQNYKSKHSKY